MNATRTFTKPVDTEPPLVAIITTVHRPMDHPWITELVDSIQAQSYPHIELWAMENLDNLHNEGELRNKAVEHTNAPLCLFMAECDVLITDYVASMVALYKHAKHSGLANLVHISSGITALFSSGATSQVLGITAPGMYEREYLVDHPFSTDPGNVDHLQRLALASRAQMLGKPVTFATTHHFGYILRDHPFRRDGIIIRRS